jgi:enoyl-[acyl-carrier protein] reductase III
VADSAANQEFRGKLALITGGGRGIGRAIALELASRGADILVNYLRKSEEAEQTAAEVRQLGVKAEAIRGNVGDESKVGALFDQIQERYGYLDILINNAASGVNKPALELTAHHWDWTLNINARASLLCAQRAVPLMEPRGGGAIVGISSLGSGRVMKDYLTVGVSKAALESLTRYLAVELAPRGIRVNAVSGGLVETDALKSFDWGAAVVEASRERTPAGRLVEPADIARTVAWLCSESASMIRGQTVVVDGGFSLLA